MKGILINPFDKTITKVEGEFKLDDIYALLKCETITAVGLGKGQTMFVDDEGLLKPRETMEYFLMGMAPQPFAGSGLILGITPEGDNASTFLEPEMLKSIVTFLDKKLVNPDDYTGWEIHFT